MISRVGQSPSNGRGAAGRGIEVRLSKSHRLGLRERRSRRKLPSAAAGCAALLGPGRVGEAGDEGAEGVAPELLWVRRQRRAAELDGSYPFAERMELEGCLGDAAAAEEACVGERLHPLVEDGECGRGCGAEAGPGRSEDGRLRRSSDRASDQAPGAYRRSDVSGRSSSPQRSRCRVPGAARSLGRPASPQPARSSWTRSGSAGPGPHSLAMSGDAPARAEPAAQ